MRMRPPKPAVIAGFLFFSCLGGPALAGQADDWARDPQVIHDFEQGRELRRAGKLAEAAAAYQRVLARAPNLGVAHLNLGLVRHDQHNYAESTEEFSRAVALDPSLRQARLYLGIDAYLWGRNEMARQALEEAAKAQPDDPEVLYWLGLAQAGTGDLRSAAESLEAAARLKPKDEDALYQLEEVYLQLWKASYDRMVAADPESFRIHQVLAEGDMQSNRIEDAKREYALVLRANPKITGVHETLGDIARQQGDLNTALKEYQAELQVSPGQAPVWYRIADVKVESGAVDEAAKAAQTSLAIDPNFGPAYYVMGQIAQRQGRSAEALGDFEKALKLGVHGDLEERTHYQLFRLLTAAGKPAEADEHKRAYLRLQQQRQARALDVAERERKVEELAH